MSEREPELYHAMVTRTGNMVSDLAQQGLIILFNDNAPDLLGEYCVLHESCHARSEWGAGNHLALGDRIYDITAVGNLANQYLNDLGHITLRFDGASVPRLPGCVHLRGEKLHIPEVREQIRIFR